MQVVIASRAVSRPLHLLIATGLTLSLVGAGGTFAKYTATTTNPSNKPAALQLNTVTARSGSLSGWNVTLSWTAATTPGNGYAILGVNTGASSTCP